MPSRRQQQAEIRQRCEAKYRLGTYSSAELAAEFDVAEATIRKWVSRYGWKREPLPGALSSVADRTAVRSPMSQPTGAPSIADTAGLTASSTTASSATMTTAQATAQAWNAESADALDTETSALIQRHRSIGGRFERVIEHLVARLEEQVANQKMLVAIKDDVVEVDVPLEYVGKVLNAATQTFERVMKVQRQSYGLNDKPEDSRRPAEGLSDSELEQKIRHLTDTVNRGSPGSDPGEHNRTKQEQGIQ